MARDCIATWLRVDPDAFDVVIEDELITRSAPIAWHQLAGSS